VESTGDDAAWRTPKQILSCSADKIGAHHGDHRGPGDGHRVGVNLVHVSSLLQLDRYLTLVIDRIADSE